MPNDDLARSIARIHELWGYEGCTQDHIERLDRRFGAWPAPAIAEAIAHCGDAYTGTLAALRQAVQMLELPDRAVADAVLNLGMLYERATGRAPFLRTLYGNKVGTRRAALRDNWKEVIRLHNGGTDPDPLVIAPSDSTLRSKLEKQMALALALVLHEVTEAQVSTHSGALDALVLGGAVMDIVFRLPDTMPRPNTSVQVRELVVHPGGKGLGQAVGSARLDLNVAILTALGSDAFGNEIVDYLKRERVRTHLIKRVEGSQSPITGVIQYSDRTSVALGWKNAEDIRLSDLEIARLRDGLKMAKVFLLTFELPPRSINLALKIIKDLPISERPITIVTPAPPLPSDELDRALLSAIDILVANKWEAAQFIGGSEADTDALGSDIRRLGIRNVCIPSDGECFTYTDGGVIATPAWPIKQGHESAGERDALCAALAYRLTREEGAIDEATLVWATAAMARHSISYQLAAAMPTLHEVTAFMESHSSSSIAQQTKENGR